MTGVIHGNQPSIVKGSNVISNITVELVKKGLMYTLQTVFQNIDVESTKDILIDSSLFTGQYAVLYDFSFGVTQGKALAQFFAGGTYVEGTPIYIANRNEQSTNVAKTVISEDPTVTTLGLGGYKYSSGGEAQGNNLAGGNGGDGGFPLQTNPLIPRLLRFIQAGGTGTFDLQLRLVFAEIP